MCGCGGTVSVGCFVVILSGAVVWALRHNVLLVWLDASADCGDSGFLSGHSTAIHGEDGSGDVVAGGRAEIEGISGEIFGLAPACGGDAVEDLA